MLEQNLSKFSKLIYDYYPSRNFPEKIDSSNAKQREATKRYKRYKHYTSESKESSTMLFSAITPYFLPLYSQLFGILYAIFPCV